MYAKEKSEYIYTHIIKALTLIVAATFPAKRSRYLLELNLLYEISLVPR